MKGSEQLKDNQELIYIHLIIAVFNYNSRESSASTHICKFPSRYSLAYSSGSSMASVFNAQSDPEELNKSTLDYVYGYYNHIRPHSSNGYMTPFEKRYSNQ